MMFRCFLIMITFALAACSEPQGRQALPDATKLTGEIFGTFYEVTLLGHSREEELTGLSNGVRQTLERVDRQMSTYIQGSDLNRLNDAGVGKWVDLPEELIEVLAEAQRVAGATDGAFDVTVGALVNLWSFGPEARPKDRPEPELLAQYLSEVGFRNLEVDPLGMRARRLGEVYVDLSGIAKGFGVDAVADFLEESGVEHFLVNIGGDMIAKGERGPERPWLIGVEAPHDRAREAHHVVPLNNMSLATSGDYRNYFEADGQRYSHTIDSRTGEPVNHTLASVSVFYPSNTTADALATAFMVMGVENTLAYADEQGVAVLLIEREGGRFKSRWSQTFEDMVEERWMLPIRNSRFQ